MKTITNFFSNKKEKQLDLIMHLGLLYHFDNIEFSLNKCAKHTENLVLETEVYHKE